MVVVVLWQTVCVCASVPWGLAILADFLIEHTSLKASPVLKLPRESRTFSHRRPHVFTFSGSEEKNPSWKILFWQRTQIISGQCGYAQCQVKPPLGGGSQVTLCQWGWAVGGGGKWAWLSAGIKTTWEAEITGIQK